MSAPIIPFMSSCAAPGVEGINRPQMHGSHCPYAPPRPTCQPQGALGSEASVRSYEARPAPGDGGAGRNDPRVAPGLPRMVAFGVQMDDQGCRDQCRCFGPNCARNHRDAEASARPAGPEKHGRSPSPRRSSQARGRPEYRGGYGNFHGKGSGRYQDSSSSEMDSAV